MNEIEKERINRLKNLAQTKTSLEGIVETLIGTECITITPNYFSALRKAKTEGEKPEIYSLPVRLAFGERLNHGADPITELDIRLCMQYISSAGIELGRAGFAIPKSIYRILGVSQKDSSGFLSALFEKALSNDDPDFQCVFRQCILTDDAARSILLEGGSSRRYSLYFGVPPNSQKSENLALFMLTMIHADGFDPGDIQDRIPNAVSDIFDISKHSLPELQIAADLWHLESQGLINGFVPDKLRDQMPERLASLSWFMNPFLYNALKDMPGLYARAMAFNTGRHIQKNYPQFNKFYAQLSDQKLLEFAFHSLCESESCQKATEVMAEAGKYFDNAQNTIDLRSIWNIAYYLVTKQQETNQTQREISRYLPSVARFMLGESEPISEGTGTIQRMTETSRRRRYVSGVTDTQGKIYALNPLKAYDPDLPSDAPILVPAAVAESMPIDCARILRYGRTALNSGEGLQEYVESTLSGILSSKCVVLINP